MCAQIIKPCQVLQLKSGTLESSTKQIDIFELKLAVCLDYVCNAHLVHEVMPWIEAACKLLAENKLMHEPGAWHIRRLDKELASNLFAVPGSEASKQALACDFTCLKAVFELHAWLGTLSKATWDIHKKSTSVDELAVVRNGWEVALPGLTKALPKATASIEMLHSTVTEVFQEVFDAELERAVQGVRGELRHCLKVTGLSDAQLKKLDGMFHRVKLLSTACAREELEVVAFAADAAIHLVQCHHFSKATQTMRQAFLSARKFCVSMRKDAIAALPSLLDADMICPVKMAGLHTIFFQTSPGDAKDPTPHCWWHDSKNFNDGVLARVTACSQAHKDEMNNLKSTIDFALTALGSVTLPEWSEDSTFSSFEEFWDEKKIHDAVTQSEGCVATVVQSASQWGVPVEQHAPTYADLRHLILAAFTSQVSGVIVKAWLSLLYYDSFMIQ
jgi:hypothetical protein